MGRIFEVQAKNLDTFRRKKRRKLRKGDVVRIFGVLPDNAREQLDLRPKTKDVLFTKKYANTLREVDIEVNVLEIGSRPGGFSNSGTAIKSSSAILDSFPNLLLIEEREAIKTYLDAELFSGNFVKFDSTVFFNLFDPVNSLWDIIRKVTMITIDSPIHTPGIGYITDGTTQYITGFNPLIDGSNYQLNNAILGIFIADVGNINDGIGHTPVGGGDVDSRADFFINISGLAKQSFRINTEQPNGVDYDTPLVNDQLLMSARTGSTQSNLYNDGISVVFSSIPSNTVPNGNIDIGRLNNDGVGINYTQATFSSFVAGAGMGFAHKLHYDNLVRLNTTLKNITLDVDAQAILNRMTTVLTPTEQAAINNFVVREKAAGNWLSYEEIQCYSLDDNQNKVIGWFGLATAIPSAGAVIGAKEITTGLVTNSHIDTGLDMVGLTKFTVENNHSCIFTEEIIRTPVGQIINLNPDGGPTYDIYTYEIGENLNSRSFNSIQSKGIIPNPLPYSTLTISRTDSTNSTLYVDGVPFNNSTQSTSSPTNDARFYLGARVTTDSQYYNGRYKFFSVGSAINDVVAQNINIRQLILDLG